MIKIAYEGVDITNRIQIHKSIITDNSGGIPDTVDIMYSDTEGRWSQWQPKKGERLTVSKDGFTSGIMYFDEWQQKHGKYYMRAISVPLSAREKENRTWEKIKFLTLANDLASKAKLSLQSHDVKDYEYQWVTQNEAPLELLDRLCVREGYALKVYDGKAVIYRESEMEATAPVLTIDKYSAIAPVFDNQNSPAYSSCIVKNVSTDGSVLQFQYTPPNSIEAPVLKIETPVYNSAEAERFAKGFLRNKNKWEKSGRIPVDFNPNIAAGNTIQYNTIGMGDGKYFVYKTEQDLTENKTILYLRGILEGY